MTFDDETKRLYLNDAYFHNFAEAVRAAHVGHKAVYVRMAVECGMSLATGDAVREAKEGLTVDSLRRSIQAFLDCTDCDMSLEAVQGHKSALRAMLERP